MIRDGDSETRLAVAGRLLVCAVFVGVLARGVGAEVVASATPYADSGLVLGTMVGGVAGGLTVVILALPLLRRAQARSGNPAISDRIIVGVLAGVVSVSSWLAIVGFDGSAAVADGIIASSVLATVLMALSLGWIGSPFRTR